MVTIVIVNFPNIILRSILNDHCQHSTGDTQLPLKVHMNVLCSFNLGCVCISRNNVHIASIQNTIAVALFETIFVFTKEFLYINLNLAFN